MTHSQQTQGFPLEAPQPTEQQKGLVPRSALALILGVLLVSLVVYAFYDVNVNKKQRDKTKAKAAAVAIGEPPPLKELREIRAQQEAASAPAVSASPGLAASEPARTVLAAQPPVPTSVLSEVGSRSTRVDVPTTKPLTAEQERMMADARAKAESAEAEHRARVLTSPLVRLENKDDRGAQQQGVEALAARMASIGSQAEGGSVSDLQRLVEQERDQVLRTLSRTQGAAAPRSNAQRDSEWMREAHAVVVPAVSTATDPVSKIMLVQNTKIPAVTLQAINSDLPGDITARVTEDVKDSLFQRYVLIPKGSRLIGRYSSDLSPGQERVLMAFARLVLPNGQSVNLAGSQGVDGQGQAGLAGDVNNHWFKMFGHSLAIALIADKAMPDKGVKQSTSLAGSTSTRTVAGEVVADVAKRVLDRNTHIPPTITAPVGERIFVSITSDLPLVPWSDRGNYAH